MSKSLVDLRLCMLLVEYLTPNSKINVGGNNCRKLKASSINQVYFGLHVIARWVEGCSNAFTQFLQQFDNLSQIVTWLSWSKLGFSKTLRSWKRYWDWRAQILNPTSPRIRCSKHHENLRPIFESLFHSIPTPKSRMIWGSPLIGSSLFMWSWDELKGVTKCSCKQCSMPWCVKKNLQTSCFLSYIAYHGPF